jgi:hypothetical protein
MSFIVEADKMSVVKFRDTPILDFLETFNFF